ncbi:protein NLRC3-like, partial [Engraulis encrasicolus]|uniref:protein NLRC3-like n=1 Tax=Engraulis encrasicolus TaxID=184585 RepID=UPI002FD21B6D
MDEPEIRETDPPPEERAPIESRPDSPVSKRVKWSMDHPAPSRETDPPPEESVQQGASDTQNLKTDETKRDTAEHRLTPEEAELRSFLKEKCQHLVEGVPHQGDARLLQDIYTDLYITEGGSRGVNEEHEVRQIDRASMFYNKYSYMSDDEEGKGSDDDEEGKGSDDDEEHEVRQIDRASWRVGGQARPIKCSDIFKPLPVGLCPRRGLSQHKPIRVVLTKGVAGIGKTVSVQKFILDWTEGETNQDIHFIFPLPFRELNLMKDTKLSLVELVQRFFTQIKDLKLLSSSENKTLFIFDGLDECRLPLDFFSNPRCCEVTEPASVDVLLTNLIDGNLLPSAHVWITTRPAAAGQIPSECVDQVTEIRGFNDPQKDDYFKKRISDENLAMRVINHLKLSRSLYIMCHIPVFAWILASVAEKTSERGEMPRTLTQMYTRFLNIQTCIKKEKYTKRRETDEEMVLKLLGRLAFQQLEKVSEMNHTKVNPLISQLCSELQHLKTYTRLQWIWPYRHAVVEHIDRRSGQLTAQMLLPGEWKTRKFRFELSEEQLGGFDLQKYIKTPEEDLTDLLSPDDVLKKLVPAVSSAL